MTQTPGKDISPANGALQPHVNSFDACQLSNAAIKPHTLASKLVSTLFITTFTTRPLINF